MGNISTGHFIFMVALIVTIIILAFKLKEAKDSVKTVLTPEACKQLSTDSKGDKMTGGAQ